MRRQREAEDAKVKAEARETAAKMGCASTRAGSLSRCATIKARPTQPLVSYQTYRQLSGWNLPPLALRAIGRRELSAQATKARCRRDIPPADQDSGEIKSTSR
jgi:hypothetical protein